MRVGILSSGLPFARLIGELAYRRTGGPELAYVFERFGKSER